MTAQDFTLPRLNPFLKLHKSADDAGEPVWSLHNPASNAYYKIAWAEFECLARFSRAVTASDLKSLVEQETTLRLELSEIYDLARFLVENGLTALGERNIPFKDKSEPLWKKILHGYLYFTVPLFEPEAFLKKTLPYVRPLLSKTFIASMMTLLAVAVLMTLQRADEFFHSFASLFSFDGIILGLIVLGFVKIVHEFAHAYTAIKYNIPVPHMGIAVIVMYPVLYTETTGGWQLSSRRERFHIGIAGITAELCLAAIFLILWNIMPAGSDAQSICFTVVTVSLVGSLLVNLNPLMRFDGYYMLGDLLGIENMQYRACNFARWKIRKTLFALADDPPEYLAPATEKFLTWFGLVLLVYRFFLFAGISVLVYHIFFKPLGLILMLVEIIWFIGLPVWSELKVWWARRREIIKTKRARLVASAVAFIILLLILPLQRTVYIPAVLHAGQYSAVFPYAASHIDEILVTEGQGVRKGDVLMRLSSFELDKKTAIARQKVEKLETLKLRMRTNPALLKEKFTALDAELETARTSLSTLLRQKEDLTVVAPFAGTIRDMSPEIKAGRYVRKTDLLLRIVGTQDMQVTGYVDEADLGRIEQGSPAVFIPDATPYEEIPLRVTELATMDTDSLPWPELSSLHHGPLASEFDREQGRLVPLGSIYDIKLTPVQAAPELSSVQIGQVRVKGRLSSPVMRFISRLGGLFVREIGLN